MSNDLLEQEAQRVARSEMDGRSHGHNEQEMGDIRKSITSLPENPRDWVSTNLYRLSASINHQASELESMAADVKELRGMGLNGPADELQAEMGKMPDVKDMQKAFDARVKKEKPDLALFGEPVPDNIETVLKAPDDVTTEQLDRMESNLESYERSTRARQKAATKYRYATAAKKAEDEALAKIAGVKTALSEARAGAESRELMAKRVIEDSKRKQMTRQAFEAWARRNPAEASKQLESGTIFVVD